ISTRQPQRWLLIVSDLINNAMQVEIIHPPDTHILVVRGSSPEKLPLREHEPTYFEGVTSAVGYIKAIGGN
ncbi:MAG: hypothetical protein AB8F95_20615, partial [Bacteroidia bacterium]